LSGTRFSLRGWTPSAALPQGRNVELLSCSAPDEIAVMGNTVVPRAPFSDEQPTQRDVFLAEYADLEATSAATCRTANHLQVPGSLQLGPGEPDYLAPFLDFFCDQLSKISG
jgi:hypothetical protein